MVGKKSAKKEAKKTTAKKTGKKAEKKKEETKEVKEKKEKLAKLLEKAKKLEEAVEKPKELDKRKLKEEEKETLVPMDDYLKASIHLGTKIITPDMRPFVYRRRADGLAVFNTALLDDKLREGADYLSKFAPEQVILICKREAGWKAANLFSEVTGIRAYTKKYPAGVLTNSNLEDFIEADLVLICDPWLDKNALIDAQKIKIPVLAICDTNNYTKGINQIISGNNKSQRSLGIIFYLLAKLYNEKRKLGKEIPPVKEWIDNWDELKPPK